VIRVNGRVVPYEECTVEELVKNLQIDPRGVAVAINGDVVRRGDWARTVVSDESTIEIVTAAAGG